MKLTLQMAGVTAVTIVTVGCGSANYRADATIACLRNEGAVVSYRAVTDDYTVQFDGGLLSRYTGSGGNLLSLDFAEDSGTAKRGLDAISDGGLAAYRRRNVTLIWGQPPTASERSEVDHCLTE